MSVPSGMSNELSGPVTGPVVQAGSVHGGIHVHPPATGRLPVPRQVQPPAAHFVDRGDPLRLLERAAADAVSGRGCRIVLVHGAGGTGKTELAAQFLCGCADLFPGGQFHAGLGAFSPARQIPPASVLHGWLRATGIGAEAMPRTVEEASALWRTLTSDAPVAVLADDAATAAQVTAVLPARGLVVVTSRLQLTGLAAAGADLLQLGPLTPVASAELTSMIIGQRARDDPDSAAGLTRACGGPPLAIRAVCARVVLRPAIPLSHTASQLAAACSALAALDVPEISMTASLDASYAALSTEAARAYRHLALCPGISVPLPAAAAALGTSQGQAAAVAAELTAASLLQETAPGRFRFHDLIRDHARQQAAACDSPQDRQAITAAVIDCYLRWSAHADDAVLADRLRLAEAFFLARLQPSPFPGPHEALTWMDTEKDNLLAAQDAAAGLGLHQLAWQFADTMWTWCLRRHDFAAWQAVCSTGLTSAIVSGDTRAQARLHLMLSFTGRSLGQLGDARTHATEGMRLARASGATAWQASAFEHAGLISLAEGEPGQAAAEFTAGLAAWDRAGGHRRGQALIVRQLGRTRASQGRFEDALTCYAEAMRAFTAIPDPYNQAMVLTDIAETRLAQDTPAVALISLDQALALAASQDAAYTQARILTIMADAHSRNGSPGRASSCLTEATALHDTLHLPAAHPARQRTADLVARIADSRPP